VRVRAYDVNLNLSGPSATQVFTTGSGTVAWRANRASGRIDCTVRVAAGIVQFAGLPHNAHVLLTDLAGKTVDSERVATGVYQYRVSAPGSAPKRGMVRVVR
jgi:hypothetical protein